MPPPIRQLADRYLYDPVTIQVRGGDADDRHRRAVPAAGGDEGEGGQAGGGAARGETRPGDRVRAHEDPLRSAVQDPARPRDERAGAARRHEPGLARRRDAGVQGRARADPRGHRRGGAGAGHLDGDARGQLRRADEPRHLRAPHRAHRAGGALGPGDHVRGGAPEARAGGDRAAHRDVDRGVGAGREERADAGEGAPAPAFQAGHQRAKRTRRRPTRSSCSAAGAPAGCAWRTSSAR